MRKTTPALIAVLGAAVLAFTYSTRAAEQDSDAGDESEEVFVPTEEISEDFPAPFPVDI